MTEFQKKGAHSCLKSADPSSTIVRLELKISEGVVEQLFLYKNDIETIDQKISRLTKKHSLDDKKATKLRKLLEAQLANIN